MANLIEMIIRLTGAKQAGDDTKGLAGELMGVDAQLAKIGLGVGLGALFIKTVQWTGAAMQGAAEDERLAFSLEQVAGGAENAATYIEALTRATGGQVEDTVLARMAMQLLSMETVESAREAEDFVEIARRLGGVFGQLSPEEAVTGFARMAESGQVSARFLIQYGMSATAVKQRVDELASSMPGLTDQQRTQQALLEVGAETMARLGPEQQNLVTGQREMAAAMDDFKDSFGAMILALAGGTGTIDFITAQFRAAKVDAEAWVYVFKDAIPAIRAYFNEQSAGAGKAAVAAETTDEFAAALWEGRNNVEALRISLAANVDSYDEYTDVVKRAETRGIYFADQLIMTEAEFVRVTAASQRARMGIGDLSMGAQIAASRMATLKTGIAAVALAANSARASYAGMGAAMSEDYEAERPLRQVSYDQDQAALEAQNEQRVRAQEEGMRAYQSAIEDTASTLRSTIESVLQPTLSEVWKPPEGAEGRIDEWARRLATMSTGNLDSEWRAQLTAQFGGQGFFQPIMDALSAGDSGALAAAVNNVLMGPGVTQMWDKDLIKAKVLEQLQASNAREELINTVMAELSGQGIAVTAGEVGVAMGGAVPGGDIAGQLVGGMKAGLPGALAESGMALTLIASLSTTLAGNKREMEALALVFMKNFNSYLPAAMGMAPGGFLEALVTYVSARLGGGAGSVRATKAEARP